MRHTIHTVGIAALALACQTLPAQLAKGTTAPEFDIGKAWSQTPISFAELKGKVILLEFFATW